MKKIYLRKEKVKLIQSAIFQIAANKIMDGFFDQCSKNVSIKKIQNLKIQKAKE